MNNQQVQNGRKCAKYKCRCTVVSMFHEKAEISLAYLYFFSQIFWVRGGGGRGGKVSGGGGGALKDKRLSLVTFKMIYVKSNPLPEYICRFLIVCQGGAVSAVLGIVFVRPVLDKTEAN